MTGGPGGDADVVVVGAGAAGCVVARRLADAGADVLLLEAGTAAATPLAGLLDIGPGSRVVARHPATLGDTALELPRGRAVGGSGAGWRRRLWRRGCSAARRWSRRWSRC